MLRFLMVLVCGLAFAGGATAGQADRVALVVGNGAYASGQPLANPVNDAKKVADSLARLGFEVHRGFDLSKTEMETLLRSYGKAVEDAEIALVYYAGHGIQVAGENYLLPIDAAPEDAKDLDFFGLRMDLLMRQINRNTRYRIVILDACRDNPFVDTLSQDPRSSSIGPGLAELAAPEGGNGALVVFSTDPGNVALDGTGEHSPFTAALLRHMETPDTNILSMLTRVNRDVVEKTEGQQRPWMSASLTGDVVLAPTPETAAIKPLALAATQEPIDTLDLSDTEVSAEFIVERDVFQTAQRTGKVEDFRAYLDSYPNGHYAQIARNAIVRLKAQGPETGDIEQAEAATETADEPDLKTTIASQETEDAMKLGLGERRSIQRRLALLGYEIGTADGVPGPNTRLAVSQWQSSNGFYKSGYLNRAQYNALRRQTRTQYANWISERQEKLALTRSLAKKHADQEAEAEARPETPVGKLKSFFTRRFPVTEDPGPGEDPVSTQ